MTSWTTEVLRHLIVILSPYDKMEKTQQGKQRDPGCRGERWELGGTGAAFSLTAQPTDVFAANFLWVFKPLSVFTEAGQQASW